MLLKPSFVPRFLYGASTLLPPVEKTDLLRLLHREENVVTWGSYGVVNLQNPCGAANRGFTGHFNYVVIPTD